MVSFFKPRETATETTWLPDGLLVDKDKE